MKTFQEAVRTKDFTLTAQLHLNQDTSRLGVINQAKCLSAAVDAVTVPANPHGVIHMAGLAAASLLIEIGIDPLLHIASRDRNQIALRSEFLGAATLGVTSLVVQRGDKLPKEFKPKTRQVFEIGAKKMLTAANQLSTFQAQRNEPGLFLGTLATVFSPARDWEPKELMAKADAGAQFILTQVCSDMALLRRYMAALVAARVTHRCHVVVSIPVLPSAESAKMLNENLRGPAIPKRTMKRLADSEAPEQLGIEICAELLQELKQIPGIGGANLVSPGNVETIPAAVKAADLDI